MLKSYSRVLGMLGSSPMVIVIVASLTLILLKLNEREIFSLLGRENLGKSRNKFEIRWTCPRRVLPCTIRCMGPEICH